MNLEERIRVEPDGSLTAFSGKIEFGQGIRTAFAQLVANELDVPVERVRVVLGDTDKVPFDFGTFGSNSIAQEAPALRRAAAFARRTLIDRAAARLCHGRADDLAAEQRSLHVHVHDQVERILRLAVERPDLSPRCVRRRIDPGVVEQ